MQPAKLPVESIVVGNRIRKEYGDIDGLAQSIGQLGLIQPIVINARKELVAGGRRLEACKRLGWAAIPVVLAEGEGTEVELRMMELEENIRRIDMTWKEKVMSIDEVHRLRHSLAVQKGENWVLEHTGQLLGMTTAPVAYAVKVAKHLRNPASPLHQCESLADALRSLTKGKQDEANRRLAAISAAPVKKTADAVSDLLSQIETEGEVEGVTGVEPVEVKVSAQCVACEGTGVNSKGAVCPICKGTGSGIDHGVQVVRISEMLHNVDCMEFLSKTPDETFDHIITDPPYAIDMNMLAQDDDEQMYTNLDTVVNEHQVKENLDLLEVFIPLAARVLRPKGFLIMWCDYTHFMWLHALGEAAGLRVQRWPLIWSKTHLCKNEAAMYNFTKNHECAIVMAKTSATLVGVQSSSVFACNRDSAKMFKHPFAKPIELWTWILEAVAIPGQTVLDPFAGRGSGVYAAVKAGLHAIGLEKREDHFLEMKHILQDALKVWLAPKEVRFE